MNHLSPPPPPIGSHRRSIGLPAALLLLLALASTTQAGRNSGGALVVHTNNMISYTSSGDYCGVHFDNPGTCEDAITRTDKDEETPAVIWLLAAFLDSLSPSVTAIQFGIDHNLPPEQGYFADFEMCAGFEMPDPGWPETGYGNLISFGATPKSGQLIPFYWFSVYGFEGAYLGTAVYPSTQEAKFVDDGDPPEEDPILRFGVVRWYAEGHNNCPDAGDNQMDFGEFSVEWSGDAMLYPSSRLISKLQRSALVFDDNEQGSVAIDSIAFVDSELRQTLLATNAVAIAKALPGSTPADTTGWDLDGSPITLPGLADYFRIEFADTSDARMAVGPLRGTGSTVLANQLGLGICQGLPNDPLFYDSPVLHLDPQWYLRNQGLRAAEGNCGHSVAGVDIGITTTNQWPLPPETPHDPIIIGIVDTGVWDAFDDGNGSVSPSHEDLQCVTLTPAQRGELSNNPNVNFLGQHGTKMAGIAAARTNNEVGIAGVCSDCTILDIEVAPIGCPPPNCGIIEIDWADRVEYASEEFVDDGLRVLNTSFALSTAQNAYDTLVLWRAYRRGVTPVSARGQSPGSIPFVTSVSGVAHDGRFLCPASACNTGSGNWSPELDLTAPASPWAISTNTIPEWEGEFYATCSLSPSGAAAQVSGAAGWLSLMHEVLCDTRSALSPDDVAGILRATATPYAPEDPPSSYCGNFPSRFFGSGRLNVDAAVMILEAGWCAEGGDPYSSYRVARYGDPGFSVREIDTWTLPSQEKWHVFQVEAAVRIPCNSMGGLPPYVAWANPVRNRGGQSTTTRMLLPYAEKADRIEVAQAVTYCRLDLDGHVGLLTGYNFAREVGNDLEYLVEPTDLQMAYTVWSTDFGCETPPMGVGVGEGEGQCIRLISRTGQLPIKVSLNMPRTGWGKLTVYDVGGRAVRDIAEDEIPSGVRDVVWDGRNAYGHLVSPGIYFLALRAAQLRYSIPILVLEGGR